MNRSKALLLLAFALLPGCRVYTTAIVEPDYYYLNPHKDLSTIGRVALVQLDNDSSYPAIQADVTQALFQALQKKQVFGLTLFEQSDPAWQSLQLKPNTTYSLDELTAIRSTLKCDAILTGTITEYHPYPHMAIGLRLRLIDLADGELVWALEQIWDSADKTTEYRIKDYFRSELRSAFAPLHEELIAISSLKFVKFVAYEAGETISPKKIQKHTILGLKAN